MTMFQTFLDRTTTFGTQKIYKFPNGYGASVLRGPYSVGGAAGLFELAVMEFDGDEYSLCYSTQITDDVIGYLSESDVEELLSQIAALPFKAREE
jgi:hypothetical protein